MKMIYFLKKLALLLSIFFYSLPTFALSITLLTQTNTLCPNTPGVLTKLDPPAISNNKVIFRGYCDNHSAIFTNITGPMKVIAARGTRLAGQKSYLSKFYDDAIPPELTNPNISGNTAVFFGLNHDYEKAIYVFRNNRINKLINNTVPIANVPKGLFQSFEQLQIKNDGNIFFIGRGKNYSGIFQMNLNGTIKTVIGSSNLIDFSNLNVNGNTFVFTAKDSNNNEGLYAYQNGKLRTIVNQKTKIPGGIGFFYRFKSPVINNTTQDIAFIGVGNINQEGVYLYSKKKVIKIADQRTLIPNTTIKFDHFNTLSYANNRLIFTAKGFEKIEGLFQYQNKAIETVLTNLDSINNKPVQKITISNHAVDNSAIAAVVKTGTKEGVYLLQIN